MKDFRFSMILDVVLVRVFLFFMILGFPWGMRVVGVGVGAPTCGQSGISQGSFWGQRGITKDHLESFWDPHESFCVQSSKFKWPSACGANGENLHK